MSSPLVETTRREPQQIENTVASQNVQSTSTSWLGRSITNCLQSEIGQVAVHVSLVVLSSVPMCALYLMAPPVIVVGALIGYEISRLRIPIIDRGIALTTNFVFIENMTIVFEIVFGQAFTNNYYTALAVYIIKAFITFSLSEYYLERASENERLSTLQNALETWQGTEQHSIDSPSQQLTTLPASLHPALQQTPAHRRATSSPASIATVVPPAIYS
jgi:hypothetical protein